MRKYFLMIIAIISLFISSQSNANFSDIVNGVGRVTAGPGSVPGPVISYHGDYKPIIAGGDNNSIGTFAIASEFEQGRIIAVGHSGILEHPDHLDNLAFNINALKWLDLKNSKKVYYYGQTNISRFQELAKNYGFDIEKIDNLKTDVNFHPASVLIIGEVWQEIDIDEIINVLNFVYKNDGGILLAGLGWAWDTYHPDRYSEYPMRMLSGELGVGWPTHTIWDDHYQYLDSPILDIIYPFTYSSLQINIEPAEVVKEGAAWHIWGFDLMESGDTINNIAIGKHEIHFKDIHGWVKPDNFQVRVLQDKTTATATYVREEPLNLGSIHVNIEPHDARQAGAAWRIVGTMSWVETWIPENVPAGTYSIEFKDVEGFATPSNQTVNVQVDQTAVALGRYERGSVDFGDRQWIIAFYVAYWNRSADPEGLNYWMNQIAIGTVDVPGVAENFALSAEAKAVYQYFQSPETATDADRTLFVRSVYRNLLNRSVVATDEGVLYWVGELRLGRTTPGLVIGNMIHAAIQANSTDWLTIWNKVQAAEYFAQRFEGSGRRWQDSDLSMARRVLEGVTSDSATVETGKTWVDQLLQ